jgi:chaperonin cofactor prefoldin
MKEYNLDELERIIEQINKELPKSLLKAFEGLENDFISLESNLRIIEKELKKITDEIESGKNGGTNIK